MTLNKLFLLLITSFGFILTSAQNTTEYIQLVYDNPNPTNISSIDQIETNSNEVVPTIKSEMNVNEAGALTYMVPIEVLKGINSFQPNIALAYNSQSGNGQAGWGWNIVGLSMITQGGKSKQIDGITQGVQFDGNDPFYLDGQRLLSSDNINYETEKYSKIKITKQATGSDYSFIIQYTDGKIAKYKELVTGQHYISVIIDALDNEIHYSYTVENNVPRVTKISYGGNSVNTDNFSIEFTFKTKQFPIKAYRNDVLYVNSKILDKIQVSSTYDGLYRTYYLTHDLMMNQNERLLKIEVENKAGERLKPLQFNYGTSLYSTIEKTTSGNIGLNNEVITLGNTAFGNFTGNGKPFSIYNTVIGQGTQYSNFKLWSSQTGPINVNTMCDTQLFAGKSLLNDKILERDQLVYTNIDYVNEYYNEGGYYVPKDKITFTTLDLVSNQTKSVTTYIKGSFSPPQVLLGTTTAFRWKDPARRYLSGDFNNDGLLDVIISVNLIYGSNTIGTAYPNNLAPMQPILYLFEVGKAQNGTALQPTIVREGDKFLSPYSLEFNGDGIPEIMQVNRDTKKYSIYKFNLQNNTLQPITNQQNVSLNDYGDKTPIIFGDFNGDGLTDFITPKKVYSIENSSAQAEAQKMDTEQQLWWEYLNTGTGFIATQKDYTQQKLAYMAPSQRAVFTDNSSWQLFWSGSSGNTVDYTEYGSSYIIPSDFNNDGKTDLISFRKFGTVKYDFYLKNTAINNLNVNSSLSNKVFFYENKIANQSEIQIQTFETSPTTIPLDNIKIAPISLISNLSDYNQLNTYKSGIFIHDPVTRSDIKIVVNTDNFTQGIIKSVNNGTPVTQTIEYRPMVENLNNNQNKTYSTTDLGLNYPYYTFKNIGTSYLVSKINTLFDNKSLTTEYRYENGIQHLEGKGFIGFEKTYVSDAYESQLVNNVYIPKTLFKPIFWKIKVNDPLLENAMKVSTYGSLDLNKVFSKSTLTNQRLDKGNHRYLILSVAEENRDFLKDIVINKTYQYDTANDFLVQQINTNYNNIGASVEKYTYKPEYYNNQHFLFGKIAVVEKTAVREGDTFSTKEEISYNNKGLSENNKKYGNNTSPIETSYLYDNYGNVLSETLNTAGMPQALTTTYEYDATYRYLWKTHTPDGLVSESNINAIGLLQNEKSALGLTTSYLYDNWGNVTQITDYLGKITTISKTYDSSLPQAYYRLSKKREGGTETQVVFDKFDREIKSKTQSINSQWVQMLTEYDVFGKKIKVSESHFEGETPKWNTIEYDDLNRPIKNTSYTGRVAITCYEKLKVTVEDGHKKISKTLDAMGNVVRYKDFGGEIFYKYYPNGALRETNYGGIKTKVEIDGWGNKTKLIDPSAGTYLYEYDNLSRLKKETNPKGGTTIYTYDNLGRPDTEITNSVSENTQITKIYQYDPTTKLPIVITGESNGQTYTYITLYDSYFRVKGKTEVTPYLNYSTNTTFDAYGRPDVVTTSAQVIGTTVSQNTSIKNNYDTNGILISLTDTQTANTIWTIQNINGQGKTTQMQFGNGYTLNNTYDTNNYTLTQIKHAKTGYASLLQIDYDYDVIKGVLKSRNNATFSKNETYQYDELDRLLKETVNNVVTQEYTYDPRGRMTSNTEVGKYQYNESDYKLQNIQFNTAGNNLNTNRGFATIDYTSFKNPYQIALAGKDNINFEFSILKTRSASFFGTPNTATAIYSRPNRKYYSADKAIEVVKTGNNYKLITYIDGDPYSASYIKITDTNSPSGLGENYFLHRDNQSTILAITKADAYGTVVEERYFDAWGNLKGAKKLGVVQTINTMGWVNSGLLIDRGYTGHEHLYTVGLIHMNGRIYDPVLRRFLSPDNYIQDPYNTQNYNRFGYVLNNPLLYIDPSGEIGFLLYIAISTAIAILSNGINNMINGAPFWYGMGKAGTMGAISGAISFGIGAASSAIFGTASMASMTVGDAIISGISGQIVGAVLPKWEFKVGDWSFNINPVLYFGNSIGLGLNASVTYNDGGNWYFSIGISLTGFTKHYGTGQEGFEARFSAMATFDDGKTSFSLGSNLWWSNAKNPTDENWKPWQRTGIIKAKFEDFGFSYENDGNPFGLGEKNLGAPWLGDSNDSYRTAAISLSIGNVTLGTNLFTGLRNKGSYNSENDGSWDGVASDGPGKPRYDNSGHYYKNGLVLEQGPKYRFGSLYVGCQNYRIGVNSEWVRNAVQNVFAHSWIAPQRMFLMTSTSWNPFIQYQTNNPFTTW